MEKSYWRRIKCSRARSVGAISLSIARRPWLLKRQLFTKTKVKVIASLVHGDRLCRLEPRAMLPSLLKKSFCRFVSA